MEKWGRYYLSSNKNGSTSSLRILETYASFEWIKIEIQKFGFLFSQFILWSCFKDKSWDNIKHNAVEKTKSEDNFSMYYTLLYIEYICHSNFTYDWQKLKNFFCNLFRDPLSFLFFFNFFHFFFTGVL